LGYSHSNTSIAYATASAMAQATVLADVPCYESSTDSSTVGDACYDQVMRLAYLNQQQDHGSLLLRDDYKCLTQTQLDAYANQDTAYNHPLNCAKMNAKPFPYFDGGVMNMRKAGNFSFFGSRNNNFSNRQSIGFICVGPSCALASGTVSWMCVAGIMVMVTRY
jgi:hypothetical protein